MPCSIHPAPISKHCQGQECPLLYIQFSSPDSAKVKNAWFYTSTPDLQTVPRSRMPCSIHPLPISKHCQGQECLVLYIHSPSPNTAKVKNVLFYTSTPHLQTLPRSRMPCSIHPLPISKQGKGQECLIPYIHLSRRNPQFVKHRDK
jgi:hypothetical protein